MLAACVALGVIGAASSGAGLSDYGSTLFLTKTASSIGSGNWQLLTSAPSSADNTSQNRVNFGAANTGYVGFAPGVAPCGTCNNAPAAAISVSSCTGWIVEGTGGMTFPAGSWSFRATVEDPNSANGQARLTAALYVVDATGSVVATVVPPTDGPTNLIRSSPPATTTETISASASGFSLDTNQHLCLMFWRHQTTAYTSGGAATRLFRLDVNDGTAAITSFPSPDGFPTTTLASTPADGSSINASGTVTLGATYSDPESEAGTVLIQVCPTSACSTQQATTTFNGVASGSSVSWSPSLPDGTWYWRARATDSVGGQSWAATHSFTLDTTAPSTPALVSPADMTTTNSLDLKATFSDPSVADTGTVEFRLCADAFCSSVLSSGSSSSVANSATASWTINPAPSDGSYYWEARADDAAGNVSSWSASRFVTFDRTVPTTTIDSGPAQPSTNANASFTFHASESATFECNLDGAGWGTLCTSPQAYGGLADGSHTLQVRATDGVGNVGTAASYTWSVDTTVPSSPTLIGPADGALVNAAALGGTFSDPTAGDTGVVDVRICTSSAGAGTTCSGLVQSGSSSTVTSGSSGTYTPSGIADGTYTWQARARDTAGNQSGWTATRSFTLDSTPPDTSVGATQPPTFTNSTSATFGFAATEVGSTFKCSLDGAAFTPCSSPVAYSSLTEGTHTFSVEATDQAGNTDPSPAVYSWTVDMTPPTVPALESPANGAWTNTTKMSATFSESNFAEPGWVEFRICSDAVCLAAPASGASPSVSNGASASWDGAPIGDGYYWWQARAHDAAGNVSAWSAPWGFHLDATPPAAPTNFNGTIGANGLTLRWDPPVDTIANFVVYVNGDSGPYLGGTTYEYNVGAFDAGDTRTFSVRAVDQAGNFGAMSTMLVGVPNLVGLTLHEANQATKARGLVLHTATALRNAGAAVVVAQDPAAGTVEEQGGAVRVVVNDARRAGVPLTMDVQPTRAVCARSSILRVHLRLSLPAFVGVRFERRRGRAVAARSLGRLPEGDNVVRLRLPKAHVSRVVFVAAGITGTARTTLGCRVRR